MKRFAVILIIAVLALGCVFATVTGDNGEVTTGTNGDKVIVTTDINVIYPVYMITASNGDVEVDSASSASEIAAKKIYNDSNELTDVQIDISLKHFGYQGNDTATNKKTYIRYAKNVTVTIEAKALENKSSNATGHVLKSANPTVIANGGNIANSADFASSNNVSDNKLEVLAEYKTGKRVGNAEFNQEIATCTFNWNVEELTAGDTYKADIIVTYENV